MSHDSALVLSILACSAALSMTTFHLQHARCSCCASVCSAVAREPGARSLTKQDCSKAAEAHDTADGLCEDRMIYRRWGGRICCRGGCLLAAGEAHGSRLCLQGGACVAPQCHISIGGASVICMHTLIRHCKMWSTALLTEGTSRRDARNTPATTVLCHRYYFRGRKHASICGKTRALHLKILSSGRTRAPTVRLYRQEVGCEQCDVVLHEALCESIC